LNEDSSLKLTGEIRQLLFKDTYVLSYFDREQISFWFVYLMSSRLVEKVYEMTVG